ncbi:hypothetical protein EDC56_0596 [Sinobacterium caligoides]|uniref:Uncharacterized protein n=1 Tax=Sinobacterium caligoides TaxID=933926 RepID=A0A3N2DZ37_9GAMM|nr:hypothetical protein [Sinobacterium caligoides]ROS05074.1 hypothetical protein EDC56_0596 [Sinobacterium caligoides]
MTDKITTLKTMFSKAILALGIVSPLSSVAAEVDAIFSGTIVDSSSQQEQRVALYLSYDSQAFSHDDFGNYYQSLEGSVSAKLYVGGVEYRSDESMVLLDIMVGEGNTQEQHRLDVNLLAHLTSAETGEAIDGVRLEAFVDTAAIPDQLSDFSTEGTTISFMQQPDDGGFERQESSFQVANIYQQPILGCLRQTAYEVVALTAATAEQPAQTMTAQITLSPRSFYRDDDSWGERLYDNSIGSHFNVQFAGQNYTSVTSNDQQTPYRLMVDATGYQQWIFADVINDANTLQGRVELLLRPSVDLGPELRGIEAISPLRFADGDLGKLIVIADSFVEADIQSVTMLGSNCNLVADIKAFSDYGTIHNPGFGELALIPASGGKLYVDRFYHNYSDKTQKLRRWAVIEWPTGQLYPHGGAGGKKVLANETQPEFGAKLTIPSYFPAGHYRYHFYTLGANKDAVPQKKTIHFYKEANPFM